ncbi:MAG: hypothetical protein AAFX76_07680 [Planctomycetota bacterium]
MRTTFTAMLCLGGAVAACLSAVTIAQPVASETPRRLVERFDFEDINDQGVKLGSGLALPPSWYPVGRNPQSRDPNFDRLPIHDRLSRRAGFPPHNAVGYSPRGEAYSGDYSLRLAIDGGSAGAYLQVGALPAVPGSDYLVTARIRTAMLEHSAARVRAYFVDAGGQRIETSVRLSRRIRTRGAWTPIDLLLPGEFRNAAYVGIEVELVQPVSDPRDILGNHQVVLTDVEGAAWFDDIAVWQLPHVEIGTQSPVNVTRGTPGPAWDIRVRDLVGGRLTARLRVYDHAMRLIAEDRRPMGWGAPSKWGWSPDLPGYGWYLAELSVIEGAAPKLRGAATGRVITIGGGTPRTLDPPEDQVRPGPEPSGRPESTPTATEIPGEGERVIARTYNAVLWLPPGTGPVGADAERFALDATGEPGRTLKLLPELARKVGLGTVIVSAWDRNTTVGSLDLRVEELTSVVAPLKNAGRRVELSFEPVPEALRHTRGILASLPMEVFSADPELWMPYAQPVLVEQGQRVNTWHLGSPDRPEAAYLPGLGSTLRTVYTHFRRWTPAPSLAVPWRTDQPARSDLPAQHLEYAVRWPAGLVSPLLATAAAESAAENGWAAPGVTRRFHLDPPPADAVGHPARVADLALRMVHAWEQDGTGVALPGLWTPGLERRASLLPDPLLGVATNVATHLAGHRAAGRLHLGDDRAAVIFEPHAPSEITGTPGIPGKPAAQDHAGNRNSTDDEDGWNRPEGMIAVWNVTASPDRAELHLYLGKSPVVHDVWGNATPLTPDAEGKHRVPLTDTPVFITGVDIKLAKLRAGFVLDEPFIESTQTPHLRTVTLTNPWPITISGKLTFTGPASWTIKPRLHAFSIGPGRTLRLPIALRFPVNEVAGTKRLTADLDFTAERQVEVELATPLRLGLEDVRLEASLSVESGKERDGSPRPDTVDAAVTCIVTNTGDREVSLNLFANLPGYSRKERLIPRLAPGEAVIRQFRFPDAAAALAQNDIRLGVRETNGPAILNQRVGVNDLE